MTTRADPDRRLYRRLRSKGRWIALTILAVTMIGLVIVGRDNATFILGCVGL